MAIDALERYRKQLRTARSVRVLWLLVFALQLLVASALSSADVYGNGVGGVTGFR